jgi:hypothetical protein
MTDTILEALALLAVVVMGFTVMAAFAAGLGLS